MTNEYTPFDQDSALENQRLSFALQAAGVGTWDLDLINQRVWWDDRCKELYGFHQDEIVPYEQVLSYMHPSDRERVDQAVQWALDPQSGGHYNIEFRTVGAEDGRLRWIHCKGKAYFNSSGIAYRFSGIAQDVTQQVTDRHALQRSEERLQTIFNHAPIGLGLLRGPDHTFELVNDQLAQMAGRNKEQMQGKPLLEALPELAQQGLKEIFDTVRQTGQRFVAPIIPVTLHRNEELETGYFYASFEPVREPDGEISIVDFSLEITQQLQAQRNLEASEAKLRSVIANAPAAIGLFIGRDLLVELPNQAFIDIVGKGPDIVGKPLREVMPELLTENQPFLQILDDVYTSGKTFQTFGSQVKIVRNNVLTDNYYNFTYSPLFDSEGQVYAILDIAIDVTEQIKARQQVEESEARYRVLTQELEQRVTERTQELTYANQDLKRSNENLQQFAYIASHDLQEPLRKIQSFSTLLVQQYGYELGDAGKDLLQRMTTAGARMSTLIKDLLTYSRISTRQQTFGSVSLNEILTDVLTTLDLEIIRRHAQIEREELPVIKGDESQLGQLFQNLLSNALKFTPAETIPQIKITCSLRTKRELPAAVRPTSDATHFHQISISDQGIGFDTKYLDRIFQVFQRLHGKNEFAGTGVGLAICQRVVENHGGGITATSKPGEGATFFVYLPV